MSYKDGIEAMTRSRGKAFKSTSGYSVGNETTDGLQKVGKDFRIAGYCIMAGLGVLAVAEIVGHRNMTFKKGSPLGSSKIMSYK
jgi:hypothetical protein